MKQIATVTDLQTAGGQLVRQAEAEGLVPISRNGRTVVFLISCNKLAALLETMELQKKPELMELIRADKAGEVRYSNVPDEV